MKRSNVSRPWYGLVAIVGVFMGCGTSGSEGDLPPQVPATEADVQSAEDQIKDNMGRMGPGGGDSN